MVWYSHILKNFPQFVVIHIVKEFGIVNKAERDIFLGLCCFFDDPTDVSGSFAFSKTSLNIWEFLIHILLTPSLEDFEDYFASIWGFPDGSAGKESTCNARDLGSIPELGRSPGEGKLPTPAF